ncbi:hypothetical protein BJ912DRAFT_1063294 [Pholiota molesta]|nr:hypothetical protein BJ912DRAFT_1063294 [Pholiota molesta]
MSTTEAITDAGNPIEDVVVERITSEVYHIERRPSEEGRCVLVHTSLSRTATSSG